MKQGRLRRGMTLQDLAEKCAAEGASVSRSTLSRIERGIQVPRPKLRSMLAQVLDLDIDRFEQDAQLSASAASSSAS